VDAELLATVRSALAERRRVHLVYDGASRDQRTERDVDLMRVVSVDGRWYAEGWCHRAGATRLFRLDRIRDVTVLDVDGTPPPEATTRDLRAGIYQPSPDATTVTLLLGPSARWVAEYYPIVAQARVEVDGTHVGEAVTMAVSRLDWLIRLVAGLGGAATILAPARVRETLVQWTGAAREQHASR
ncbi:MAG TPA: WYL domain-containing protein, partial [Intrasporangiaceae bacterium]|nr:WYL domain-containing protein [Intrasporangiaceae bacterium]